MILKSDGKNPHLFQTIAPTEDLRSAIIRDIQLCFPSKNANEFWNRQGEDIQIQR